MPSRNKRQAELYRLPLQKLILRYRRITKLPKGERPPEMTASDLIQAILDAEKPKLEFRLNQKKK
jgi:hypothetical protein